MNTPALFHPARLVAFCGALGFAFATPAAAQTTVTTVPVGVMTLSFPATTQVTTSYISIPLTNPPIFTGSVASLTSNAITFAGLPFSGTNLAAVGAPFFARIATGAQAGRTILVKANTDNSITVDTTDNSTQTTDLTIAGWAVAAGDRIEIIVGDTLGSLLGDNTPGNPLLFVGSTSAFTADTVAIYNKATSRLDAYYFNTNSGFWRLSSGTANVNNLVIYPENALQVNRRSGRIACSMTITGEVPMISQLTKTAGSSQVVYSSSRLPIDRTLGNLGLTNWNKGTSAFTADTISIYNPALSKLETYYQHSGNSQWRKSTDATTDQSNLLIVAGSSITILKRAAVSGSASYFASAIPY
jgi:uncharacterized protein (TIGR02597 family)